jgi:hypothetical protein
MSNLTEKDKEMIMKFLQNNIGKNPLVKEVIKK